jgi:5-guanidino-2-oxopentanoate decarboxylase
MPITVARYLVDLLAANDIDTVFGIPGVHNLELYRALADSTLRHVLVRHEQGAGFAADGYARASGRVAAAFVISGPGVTNILTAVAQAYSDSVPLLVVASTPARASLGKQWGVLHELRDQRAVAAGIFGVARSVFSAQELEEHLHACLACVRAPRARPAYLEVPLDLLAEHTALHAVGAASRAPVTTRSLPAADPAEIAAAVRCLRAARRPFLIAGGGARAAGEELAALATALDAPCATTAAGKGLLRAEHAANLGASLPYAATQELAAAADVVLVVGTELAETDIYTALRLPLGGLLVRIDVDADKLADHYGAALPLLGDAALTLRAINDGLAAEARAAGHSSVSGEAGTPARGGWLTQLGGAARVRAAIDAALPPALSGARAALAAIHAALPRDALVCSDMTQIAYLGNYAFPSDLPGTWFHPSGYGTLGYALPAAVGAKIAAPSRAVLALCGDFGLQFTAAELSTAVEERLGIPLVVWNNAALGQIRDDMLAAGFAPLAVEAHNPDFSALARACGAAAAHARSARELRTAIESALAYAGPTLIEVPAAEFDPR